MPRTPIPTITNASTAARHSSASAEHFTPPTIIEAARTVLGEIDLDPASSKIANRVVKATRFYDVAENGFVRSWAGPFEASRVFLNPPGGRQEPDGRRVEKGETGLKATSAAKAWWFKLVREWTEGRVLSAIFVGFSVEILQTTQVDVPLYERPRETGQPRFTESLLVPLDFPMCFPSRRLAYWHEGDDGELVEGKSPPHSSVLVYLPPKSMGAFGVGVAKFRHEFGKFGTVVRPMNMIGPAGDR